MTFTVCKYAKSHCGDKAILRPSCIQNGISYTSKTSFLLNEPTESPKSPKAFGITLTISLNRLFNKQPIGDLMEHGWCHWNDISSLWAWLQSCFGSTDIANLISNYFTILKFVFLLYTEQNTHIVTSYFMPFVISKFFTYPTRFFPWHWGYHMIVSVSASDTVIKNIDK